MKYTQRILSIIAISFLMIACKDEGKEVPLENAVEVKTDTVIKKERKVLSEGDKAKISSVFSKLMITAETKTYTSFLVSTGMAELLLNQDGPFTVIAPSNAAFEAMDVTKREFLLNPKNKEVLKTLLKSYIMEGTFNSTQLLEECAKSGSFSIKNMSGESIKISKSGDKLMLANAKGEKGQLTKIDIIGSNGVLHVTDVVFSFN